MEMKCMMGTVKLSPSTAKRAGNTTNRATYRL
jgi:hypothetical protein